MNFETTKAVKSPTLLSQISDSKKVRQLLTGKSLIKRTFNDSIDCTSSINRKVTTKKIDLLLQIFVKIYLLGDSPRRREAKKLAFANPEHYVLKPQHGDNIYKEDIPSFLKIFQNRNLINPPPHPSKIVRQGAVYYEQALSDLGIFGTIVWDTKPGKVHSNTTADYFLRSTFRCSNQGGISSEFGCVDSLYVSSKMSSKIGEQSVTFRPVNTC